MFSLIKNHDIVIDCEMHVDEFISLFNNNASKKYDDELKISIMNNLGKKHDFVFITHLKGRKVIQLQLCDKQTDRYYKILIFHKNHTLQDTDAIKTEFFEYYSNAWVNIYTYELGANEFTSTGILYAINTFCKTILTHHPKRTGDERN